MTVRDRQSDTSASFKTDPPPDALVRGGFRPTRGVGLLGRLPALLGRHALGPRLAALEFALASEFGLSPSRRAALGLTIVKGRSLQTELGERLGGMGDVPGEIVIDT